MSKEKISISDKLNFCLAPLAILGGVATVVSCIFAFLTFLSPHTITNLIYTFYPQATSEPQIVFITSSPPLVTPQPPTVPPIDTSSPMPLPTSTIPPSPTPVPDTQPETILEVGQTWRQQGLELMLRDAKLVSIHLGAGVEFLISVSNQKLQDIAISYSLDNIAATDNFSRQLQVLSICPDGSCWISCGGTEVISSGQKIVMCGLLFAGVDISNQSITEIIVTVNISNVNGARWRIPIPH